MYRRFYFTCFSDSCAYYEQIRVHIVPARNLESGGTAYEVPDLWCDNSPRIPGTDEAHLHKCSELRPSEEDIRLAIENRRFRNERTMSWAPQEEA